MRIPQVLTFLTIACAISIVFTPSHTQSQQGNNDKETKSRRVGRMTGISLDDLAKKQDQAAAPSEEDPFSLADLNRDGKCDQTDQALFRSVLGKCERTGSPALVSLADFDVDGCVTREDGRIFGQLWRSCTQRVVVPTPEQRTVSLDINYFKGSWIITMRSNPKESFRWTVNEDVKSGWLMGTVEKDGQRVSTDFWRQRENKIDRFAFTDGGTFVRIESAGWEDNRLVLVGIASEKDGEYKVRETITKGTDRQFFALWEREENGKWVVFADEVCAK